MSSDDSRAVSPLLLVSFEGCLHDKVLAEHTLEDTGYRSGHRTLCPDLVPVTSSTGTSVGMVNHAAHPLSCWRSAAAPIRHCRPPAQNDCLHRRKAHGRSLTCTGHRSGSCTAMRRARPSCARRSPAAALRPITESFRKGRLLAKAMRGRGNRPTDTSADGRCLGLPNDVPA